LLGHSELPVGCRFFAYFILRERSDRRTLPAASRTFFKADPSLRSG
jgi:hypothetical protein